MSRLLDERRTGIGGSDVAPILGLSRFRTAMDVYTEKLGLSAPLVETEAMEWGKRLEAVVAQAWSEKTGIPIRNDPRVRRHRQHRWMIAHIDRWIPRRVDGKRCLLEVKTTRFADSSQWGEEETDQVPDDYRCQVAHYMAVTNTDRCYVALLAGGSHFRRYVVDRDLELEEAMIAKESAFWHDNVLAKEPPAIDGSEGSSRYLLARYPKVEIEELDEPAGFEELALEYLSIAEAVKAAETRKDLLGNLMRERMGAAGAVTGTKYRAKWTDVKAPARTDWKAVVSEAGVSAAVVEKHTTRADAARRFTVEERKDA